MDILAAIKREERKLQKQLGKLQRQLDRVQAAAKALGRFQPRLFHSVASTKATALANNDIQLPVSPDCVFDASLVPEPCPI
jgi:hypothetical protein